MFKFGFLSLVCLLKQRSSLLAYHRSISILIKNQIPCSFLFFLIVAKMTRQLIYLAVIFGCLNLTSAFENKSESCRCQSKTARNEIKEWDGLDQENWTVDIVSESYYNKWINMTETKAGSKEGYTCRFKTFKWFEYTATFFKDVWCFYDASIKALILNDRWLLVQFGCKTGEKAWVFDFSSRNPHEIFGDPSYSLCADDAIVIGNSRVGFVKNKIKNIYNFDGQASTFPERFRLVELENPISLGDQNSLDTSFQPGCLLKEQRQARKIIYENIRYFYLDLKFSKLFKRPILAVHHHDGLIIRVKRSFIRMSAMA